MAGKWSSAIFLLLCFLPVVTTVLFGGVDNITWAMIPVVWVVIVLLWLKGSWKSGGLIINTSLLQLPLPGLIAIGCLQLLPLRSNPATDGLSLSLSSSLSLDPYTTRFFLIRLLVYTVFFAACLTFVNTAPRLQKLVTLIVSFGALMAFIAILQRLANPGGIYGLRETPQAVPFGPFVNQHHFAAFMEMTIGVTLGLMFGGVEGREKKALLAFAAVLMAIGIVWTGSRGGLIGFIATIVLVVAVNLFARRAHTVEGSGSSKAVVAIAGAALIFVALGAVLFLGGADQILRGIGINNPSGDLTTGRAHYWSIAWQVFREHPIIGAGLDAFSMAYPAHDTWNGTLRVEQAHNDYLQTMADAGVLGLACVIAFICLLFSKALKTVLGSEGFRRSAAVGALAGCFGVLVHSFFDFPLRTPSNAFFFLMLTALATVPVAMGTASSHRPRRHRRRD